MTAIVNQHLQGECPELANQGSRPELAQCEQDLADEQMIGDASDGCGESPDGRD